MASDKFLARRPDVVQRVVERMCRSAYDYNANRNGVDWTTGRYADAAGRFLMLELGNETTVPPEMVVHILASNRWPSVFEQLAFTGSIQPGVTTVFIPAKRRRGNSNAGRVDADGASRKSSCTITDGMT